MFYLFILVIKISNQITEKNFLTNKKQLRSHAAILK